jgi:probable HAF family extracellular repeat protein
MTDLRTLTYGINSTATAVNRYDVIVGWSELAWGAARAVRWTNGTRRNLGTLGGRDSKATDINNSGWIVGYSQTQNGQTHAFLWRDGVMTDLGTLGGSLSLATAINSEGVIVGYSTKEPGVLAKEYGFRWKDGVMRELPSMPGTAWAYTRPLAIRAGRIVGEGAPEEANGDWSNALIWEGGVLTNLGHLGGDYARAVDVNAAGLVVGNVEHNTPDCNVSDAFVWKDGQLGILPTLNGINEHAVATAINRTGLIAGFSETAAGASDCELGDIHAALWTPN